VSGPSTPAVDYAGHVDEAITRALRECLVGSGFGGVADELRHRLALDRGRSLNLLVELWIEAEASQAACVSRMVSSVLHARPGPDEGVPIIRVHPHEIAGHKGSDSYRGSPISVPESLAHPLAQCPSRARGTRRASKSAWPPDRSVHLATGLIGSCSRSTVMAKIIPPSGTQTDLQIFPMNRGHTEADELRCCRRCCQSGDRGVRGGTAPSLTCVNVEPGRRIELLMRRFVREVSTIVDRITLGLLSRLQSMRPIASHGSDSERSSTTRLSH